MQYDSESITTHNDTNVDTVIQGSGSDSDSVSNASKICRLVQHCSNNSNVGNVCDMDAVGGVYTTYVYRL